MPAWTVGSSAWFCRNRATPRNGRSDGEVHQNQSPFKRRKDNCPHDVRNPREARCLQSRDLNRATERPSSAMNDQHPNLDQPWPYDFPPSEATTGTKTLAAAHGSDFLIAALIDIEKVAVGARANHSVQGHHCELRSAIDSISDRAGLALKQALTTRNQNDQAHGINPQP